MEFRVSGNTLTITCQLSPGTSSKSGKTLLVASTNGFMPVEGSNLRVSLNVIKPKS